MKFLLAVVFFRTGTHAVSSHLSMLTFGRLEPPGDRKSSCCHVLPSSRELENITTLSVVFNQRFSSGGDIKSQQWARVKVSRLIPEDLKGIINTADLLDRSIFDLLHISRGSKIVGWSIYGAVCAYSIGVALAGIFFVLTKGVKQAGNLDPSNIEGWQRTMLIFLGRALVLTSGTLNSTLVGGQLFLTETFHLSVTGYNNLAGIRTGAGLVVLVIAPSIAKRTGKLPLIIGSCCIMFAAAFLQDLAMHTRLTWLLLLSGVCQTFGFGYISYAVQAITMELAHASEQSKQEAFWWFLLILDKIGPVMIVPILVELWGMTGAYLFIDTFVGVFTLVNGMLFFLLSRGLSFGNEARTLKGNVIPCKMGFVFYASLLTCTLGVGGMMLHPILQNLDYLAFDMLGKSIDDLPWLVCASLGSISAGCLLSSICDLYGKRLWYSGINFAVLAIFLWRLGSFQGSALANLFMGIGLLPGPFIVLTSTITLLVPEDRLDRLCWMTSMLYLLSGTWSSPLFGALEAKEKGLGFKVMAVVSWTLALWVFTLIPISKMYLHDVANGTSKIKDLPDSIRLNTLK